MGAVMRLLRNNYTQDRRTKRSFSYICVGPPGRFEEREGRCGENVCSYSPMGEAFAHEK